MSTQPTHDKAKEVKETIKEHLDEMGIYKEQKSPEKDDKHVKIPVKDDKEKHKEEIVIIKLNDSNLTQSKKISDKYELYFINICPFKEGYIHTHARSLKKLDFTYCTGVYIPIDRTFTVRTMLSNEFMTCIKKYANQVANRNYTHQETNENTNSNVNTKEDKANHIVIYVPGYNYTLDKTTSGEVVLNECLQFGYSLTQHFVLPFLYPGEGYLLNKLNSYKDEKVEQILGKISESFVLFLRNLSNNFEQIDFVSHGVGVKILMYGLAKYFQKYKDDLGTMNRAKVVNIAPDISKSHYVMLLEKVKPFLEHKVTAYVNTWDVQLVIKKYLQWSEDRVGQTLMPHEHVDVIDTTDIVSKWANLTKTKTHFYHTDPFVLRDIAELLDNVDVKNRSHLQVTRFKGHDLINNVKIYWKLTEKNKNEIKQDKKEQIKEKVKETVTKNDTDNKN